MFRLVWRWRLWKVRRRLEWEQGAPGPTESLNYTRIRMLCDEEHRILSKLAGER